MFARRRLYAGFLAAGLFLIFSAASASVRGNSATRAEIPVVGFVVVAVVALLWLRPRPVEYGLGLTCVFLGFAGFWLLSSDGLRWIASVLLRDPGGRPAILFGYLTFLLPVGWLFLARSVASWKFGLFSYYLTGVVSWLTVSNPNSLSGLDLAHTPPVWVLALLPLAWPFWTLSILGAFGLNYG